MRLFALKDANDPDEDVLAVLSCHGAAREYCIDMPAGTDPWSVPLMLSSFAARGQLCIDGYWAGRWVESRLVPQDRQNLGEVLKASGLDRYDTLKLLELTQGRNSQDDCYLVPSRLDDAPAWFLEIENRSIADAVLLDSARLLVAFRTGDSIICDLREMAAPNSKMTSYSGDAVPDHAEVTFSGRRVLLGRGMSFTADELRAHGKVIGLTWDDLRKIAPALLIDTGEAAEMLGCSRQNISDLVKRRAVPTAKSGPKSTLLFRSDIRRRL